MILLPDQGQTTQRIAAMFDRSERSVRSWISRHESGGCDGLLDRLRTGLSSRRLAESTVWLSALTWKLHVLLHYLETHMQSELLS